MAFCDWLSIHQLHPDGGLPIINDGNIVRFEPDAIRTYIDPETGEYKTAFDLAKADWTTQRKIAHEGSFDTSIRISCNGYTVMLDGNVGRWGRPDNVFGYSVAECVKRANILLESFGLPPFTQGPAACPALGAKITRVDITQNYRTGSPAAAARLVHYFAGHQSGRMAPKSYGNTGLTWGEGSQYWYAKLYVKSFSLGECAKERTVDYVTNAGLVRHEISLKSRYLTQHHLRTIAAWSKTQEGLSMDNVIYNRFNAVFDRSHNSVAADPFEELPPRVRNNAIAWRNGCDLWADDIPARTRRRWRNELLPYGIDIKQPCDVTRLATRVKVISMEAMEAPSWYWGESKTDWVKAA